MDLQFALDVKPIGIVRGEFGECEDGCSGRIAGQTLQVCLREGMLGTEEAGRSCSFHCNNSLLCVAFLAPGVRSCESAAVGAVCRFGTKGTSCLTTLGTWLKTSIVRTASIT